MSSVQPALTRWWQVDRKILFIFALYGLAAGTVTYIASLSFDDWFVEGISIATNFPTIMALYFATGGYSLVPHVIIISSSVAMWSFIGLMMYALIKMLKLEP